MILIGCLWLLAGELALLAAGVALLVGIATMMRLSPHQVMRWHKALPLTPGQLPELEWAVAELARRAGLPACPALYWLPVPEINAVSAGSAELGDCGFRWCLPYPRPPRNGGGAGARDRAYRGR